MTDDKCYAYQYIWNARVNLKSMQLRSPSNTLLQESIELLTRALIELEERGLA